MASLPTRMKPDTGGEATGKHPPGFPGWLGAARVERSVEEPGRPYREGARATNARREKHNRRGGPEGSRRGPYERGSGVMPAEQRGLTETCICGAPHNVREIRTSGLMSGVGKRDGHCSQHQRPSSTLPGGGLKPDEKTPPAKTGGATAEACCRYTVVLPRTRLTHTAAPPPDLPWRPAAPARSRPAGLRTPTRLPRPRASPDRARPRRIEGYP